MASTLTELHRAQALHAPVYMELGSGAAAGIQWRPRTLIHIVQWLEAQRLAFELKGLDAQFISLVFITNAGLLALEQCQGAWRPVIDELAAADDEAESNDSLVKKFQKHVKPLERGLRKLDTMWHSLVTWAVARDGLALLLPVAETTLHALQWDALSNGLFAIRADGNGPVINIFACLHQWGRTANTNASARRLRGSPEHNTGMCIPSTAIWLCGCCDSSLPNIRAPCARALRAVARRAGAACSRGANHSVASSIPSNGCARTKVTMHRSATRGRITTYRRATPNLPVGRLLTSANKRMTRAAGELRSALADQRTQTWISLIK